MVTKEQGLNISLSTIMSLIVVIPVMWLLVKPLISEALAEDIKLTVAAEIQPLNSAFVALLRTNIANTRRKIAQLEFKRDNPPPGDWTPQDVEELVNLQLDLSSSEEALAALTKA